MVGLLLVRHEGPVAEAAAVALVTAVRPLVLEKKTTLFVGLLIKYLGLNESLIKSWTLPYKTFSP